MKSVKHEELYKKLREAILTQAYPPMSRLPAENRFASELGVARNTLRQALRRLEEEGLIRRLRLHGTFVAARLPERKRVVAIDNFRTGGVSNPVNYLLPGIRHACDLAGVDLEMLPLPYFLSADPQSFDSVAGFLCFGGLFTGEEPIVQHLKAAGKNTVIVNGYAGDQERTGFRVIRPERRTAWNEVTLELRKHGAKKITFILPSGEIRGYRSASLWNAFLKRHGLWFPDCIRTVEEDANGGVSGMEEILKDICHTGEKGNAVLCYSDFIALELFRCARKLGLKIPEEFSVMGFCGYPGGKYLTPSLSTVDFHYFEMGERAVSFLLEEDPGAMEIVHPHELVWRESTMPLNSIVSLPGYRAAR